MPHSSVRHAHWRRSPNRIVPGTPITDVKHTMLTLERALKVLNATIVEATRMRQPLATRVLAGTLTLRLHPTELRSNIPLSSPRSATGEPPWCRLALERRE
jgi:hypothetical protein